MLKIVDVFFILFHSLLILFNLFGWIPNYTRRYNLLTLLITGASWFILGIFYGIGYCPLTDWHFQVLTKLGHTDLPYSYIKYLFDRLTGSDINSEIVDIATVVLFFVSLAVSLFLNIKDYKFHKKQIKD